MYGWIHIQYEILEPGIVDRKARRDNKKVLETVKRKAKQDMAEWILEINRMPSEEELLAFQAGYLSGINRGANNAE